MTPLDFSAGSAITDVLRAGLVLILALAQVAMAYWPEWRGWPHTIATRSAALVTPVIPTPPAFAIWGLLYLSLTAFAVRQALPGQWDDPLLRAVGWMAAALFALNCVWEAWVPSRDLDAVSVAVIGAELALVLWIMGAVTNGAASGAEWWLVAFPFQFLAGWVSAAFFANLSSTMLRARQRGRSVPDPRRTWAAIGLLAPAIALTGTVTALTGAWPYALSAGWAFGGIALANRDRPALAVAAVAGLAFLAIALVIGR